MTGRLFIGTDAQRQAADFNRDEELRRLRHRVEELERRLRQYEPPVEWNANSEEVSHDRE